MFWFVEGENKVNVDDVLIFDIETSSEYDISDFNNYVINAKMKWFGGYSYKHQKYFYYTYDEKQKIQDLIDEHKVIVGFNSRSFDKPIMTYNGYNFEYKVQVDLLRVLWDPDKRISVRENIIKVKHHDNKILSDLLPNHKLVTIGEVLNLSVTKGDIDYKIFDKHEWTDEERKDILKYLHADIVLTKELFEYLYKQFEGLKDFVSESDVKKYNWLRTTTGGYTYKVICNKTGMEEKYPEEGEVLEHEKYEGGFVALPTQDEARGKIYAMDFTSAYPHAFFSANLYSHSCACCDDDDKWSGNEMFPVKGKYCQKQMGIIESTIKDLFLQRLAFKKIKDPREYAIKIIINTLYGISGSPLFMSLYNTTTAGDCTLIARQMIKHARDKFDRYGYKLLYTDTDSVYLEDIFKDEERLLRVRDEIIKDIKDNLPFPQDTFDMSVDENIKAMWFFKNKMGEYSKKFYAYLSEDDKLTFKGVPLIKSTCSKVGRAIFEELKPIMIQNQTIKFSKDFIEKKVYDLLEYDMTLVAKLYKVKKLDSYNSPTCLHAQISAVLGPGNHWLIANYKVGNIGKSIKKYATIEEAEHLEVKDLFLDTIFNTELSPLVQDWVHPEHDKRMRKIEAELLKPKSRPLTDYMEKK